MFFCSDRDSSMSSIEEREKSRQKVEIRMHNFQKWRMQGRFGSASVDSKHRLGGWRHPYVFNGPTKHLTQVHAVSARPKRANLLGNGQRASSRPTFAPRWNACRIIHLRHPILRPG